MNLTHTAVVILNYNGRHWLEKFLPAVTRYSGNARIVVADNCSTDDSVSFLKEHYPALEIVENSGNFGFCGGYNAALKKVQATYYVLLNSDVEVSENWLSPIIDCFEQDKTIAAIQPKIISFNQRTHFEHAGAAGGFIDVLGYPFCRGRIFNHVEEDHGQYNDMRQVFWATGACLFIRAELFHQSGGFDADFFAHMEEIDLCWRLQRQGHRIFYHPGSTVYHVGGGTLATSNPNKTYYNFRNGLSLIFKNLPTAQLLWKFPIRIALDWVAAFTFLLSGLPAHAAAVLRAHAHFFKRIGMEQRKRKAITSPTLLPRHGAVYPGILIVDYFLRGRKNFGELKF